MPNAMTRPESSSSRVDRALILKPNWVEEILYRGKDIELRSCATKVRGRVALASGGKLFGEVTIKNCFLNVCQRDRDGMWEDISPWSWDGLYHRHHVCAFDCGPLLRTWKKIYAWELESPVAYNSPKDFFHPPGAVIWVILKHDDNQPQQQHCGQSGPVSDPPAPSPGHALEGSKSTKRKRLTDRPVELNDIDN